MNTAEIVAGELCGTAAFLGVAIGWPALWLHYASTGVLKLTRPPQRGQQSPAPPAQEVEPPAGGAVPVLLNVGRGPDGKFQRRTA